jgi:hypothetical protein
VAPQRRKAELAPGPVVFDCVTESSVLGALNAVRFDLEAMLLRVANVMELKPVEGAVYMNQRPTKAGKVWMHPNDEMVNLLGLLQKTRHFESGSSSALCLQFVC